MKKIWSIAMIGMLVFVLAACSSGANEEQLTDASEGVPLGIVTTEPTENEEETDAETSNPDEEIEENEENAVQNILKPNKRVDNYYYEYVMSTNDQHMASFKIWVNGPRLRFDILEEGQRIYLNYELNEGYLYMPDGNVLMKMPLESLGDEWESPFIFADEIDQGTMDGLKFSGKELIDGKECYVYTDKNDEMEMTYFIWKEEGLIVKMQFESKDQPSYEYYFKDLSVGENYDEELKLPDDADIVDMTKQP